MMAKWKPIKMKIRLFSPEEAEACWKIRNLSIRQGCQTSYSQEVLTAWTPEEMPEGYRVVIKENPFFAVDITNVGLVARAILMCRRAAWRRFLLCRILRVKDWPARLLQPLKMKRGVGDLNN